MTGPIINPWFIYLISLIDGIRAFCVVSIIGSAAAILISAFVAAEFERGDILKRAIKWSAFTTIFAILLLVFVPSSKTVVYMFVADFVTYENVDGLVDKLSDIHDLTKQDIIDILKALKSADTKNNDVLELTPFQKSILLTPVVEDTVRLIDTVRIVPPYKIDSLIQGYQDDIMYDVYTTHNGNNGIIKSIYYKDSLLIIKRSDNDSIIITPVRYNRITGGSKP